MAHSKKNSAENSGRPSLARSTLLAVAAASFLGGACSSATSTPRPATGGSNGSATGGSSAIGTGGGSSTTGTGGGVSTSPGGNGAGNGTGSGGSAAGAGNGGAKAGTGGNGATGPGGGTATGGVTPTGGTGAGGAGMSGTGGAPVACQAPLPVTGTALTVAVNLATTGATVPPGLLGIHTAVYDGSMTLPTTPPLLRDAGIRSLRYPGGSYGDIYHWATHTLWVPPTVAPADAPYIAPDTHFGNFIGIIESIGASAMITVNYGSDSKGTGPGVPQEAAAWVAYANGSPTSTTVIGMDSTGFDWKTVGYWASLRAAAKLAVDDGQNFLRIGHPMPVGIKYWEVGNEIYGNGYYYGGEGWEEDLHLAHDGTARKNNANLSPVKYGQVFPMFATAMKAVDPTIKVGAVLHWPYNEYADWNDGVLSAATCTSMDFGVNHWYAGSSLTDLLTRPHVDIPGMFTGLHTKVSMRCPMRTGDLPLAITEWGPNTLNYKIMPPAQTQLVGIFAADSYANFMEQGAVTVDWLELHNDSYLGSTDVPVWGYKGEQMASYLARGGDTMVQATVQATPPAAFANGLFQAHASKHADGSIGIMLVNTSPSAIAAATVSVAGLAAGAKLPCVGTSYTYAAVMTDQDGPVMSAPIFSTNDTNNRVTVQVPAYAVVVLTFPKS